MILNNYIVRFIGDQCKRDLINAIRHNVILINASISRPRVSDIHTNLVSELLKTVSITSTITYAAKVCLSIHSCKSIINDETMMIRADEVVRHGRMKCDRCVFYAKRQ